MSLKQKIGIVMAVVYKRPDDGTGRHTGLKILGSKGRAGSTPALGNSIEETIRRVSRPAAQTTKSSSVIAEMRWLVNGTITMLEP